MEQHKGIITKQGNYTISALGYCIIQLFYQRTVGDQSSDNLLIGATFAESGIRNRKDYPNDVIINAVDSFVNLVNCNAFSELEIKCANIPNDIQNCIVTLDNQTTYQLIWNDNLNDKNYIFLLNINDICDMIVCERMNDKLLSVVDAQLIIKIIDKMSANICQFMF